MDFKHRGNEITASIDLLRFSSNNGNSLGFETAIMSTKAAVSNMVSVFLRYTCTTHIKKCAVKWLGHGMQLNSVQTALKFSI